MVTFAFNMLMLIVFAHAQQHGTYFRKCSTSSNVTSSIVTCDASASVFDVHGVETDTQCVYMCQGHDSCTWTAYIDGQKQCKGYSGPCKEADSSSDIGTTYYTNGCPTGWVNYENSCYLLSQNYRLPFHDAEAYCKEYGAHLVHINSEEENTFLKDQMQKDLRYWIGLTDDVVDGEWRWYGEDTVTAYTYWNTGEPNGGQNENCAAAYGSASCRWVDVQCERLGFRPICEIVIKCPLM